MKYISLSWANWLRNGKSSKLEVQKIMYRSNFTRGAFTIYVYNSAHIFDHPPTFVYNFYAINVYKFSGYLTTHPPSIVNVNCERPLTYTTF